MNIMGFNIGAEVFVKYTAHQSQDLTMPGVVVTVDGAAGCVFNDLFG